MWSDHATAVVLCHLDGPCNCVDMLSQQQPVLSSQASQAHPYLLRLCRAACSCGWRWALASRMLTRSWTCWLSTAWSSSQVGTIHLIIKDHVHCGSTAPGCWKAPPSVVSSSTGAASAAPSEATALVVRQAHQFPAAQLLCDGHLQPD